MSDIKKILPQDRTLIQFRDEIVQNLAFSFTSQEWRFTAAGVRAKESPGNILKRDTDNSSYWKFAQVFIGLQPLH